MYVYNLYILLSCSFSSTIIIKVFQVVTVALQVLQFIALLKTLLENRYNAEEYEKSFSF